MTPIKNVIKHVSSGFQSLSLMAAGCLYGFEASAQSIVGNTSSNLGDVADNARGVTQQVSNFLMAGAFVLGIVFAFSAFKTFYGVSTGRHEATAGKGLMQLVIGGGLIALGSVIAMTLNTTLGGGGTGEDFLR